MECQDLMMVVVETDPLPYMLVTTIVCDILVLFILLRTMLDILDKTKLQQIFRHSLIFQAKGPLSPQVTHLSSVSL